MVNLKGPWLLVETLRGKARVRLADVVGYEATSKSLKIITAGGNTVTVMYLLTMDDPSVTVTTRLDALLDGKVLAWCDPKFKYYEDDL